MEGESPLLPSLDMHANVTHSVENMYRKFSDRVVRGVRARALES